MEAGYRPSNFQSYGGDRKLEIVSGKGFAENQIYTTTTTAAAVRPTQSPVTRTTSMPWGGFNDPETKRRKRIAKYKVYTIEGRVKASFRNGIRWIKSKCSDFIHGF